MKKKLLFICLISLPFLSKGQAIRVNYLCSDFYQATGSSNFYVGFGYEQNLGDKIAVSLEYNIGYGFSEDQYDNGSTLTFSDALGNSYEFDYYSEMPWNEFSYQSKYFFSGNDDNSGYLSMGIGYRKTKIKTYVGYQSMNGNSATLVPTYLEESVSSVPISLKLGYRGSIDGWFGDYFFGLTYIPGASSQGLGIPLIDDHTGSDTKKFQESLF